MDIPIKFYFTTITNSNYICEYSKDMNIYVVRRFSGDNEYDRYSDDCTYTVGEIRNALKRGYWTIKEVIKE